MVVSKFTICHLAIAMLIVFASTSAVAQDRGNAILKLERQGYADALGENAPMLQGFDRRIELQNLGFRNPDLRTTTSSSPSQSLILIVNAMSKKLAILECRIATLENEVAELREAQRGIDRDAATK